MLLLALIGFMAIVSALAFLPLIFWAFLLIFGIAYEPSLFVQGYLFAWTGAALFICVLNCARAVDAFSEPNWKIVVQMLALTLLIVGSAPFFWLSASTSEIL